MKIMKKGIITVIAMVMLMLAVPVTSSAELLWTKNETPVFANKNWEITFNKDVDAETINSSTVYVQDAKGNTQKSTPKLVNGKTVVVPAPSKGYVEGNDYTLYIDKTVQSTKQQKLTDGIKMNFAIESIQDYIVGAWKGDYIGINFLAIFHPDYTSTVILDDETEVGEYTISGTNMTMRLLDEKRTGRVDKISKNKFTITSASGKVVTFTK
ncbi:hypothetical protein CSV74_07665 [Sporosarcina sp. P19]|nr:hypothetical protein CSV74_07665 [Sporosarcina sp. P19]